MTLVIAKRTGNKVELCSDSRISFDTIFFDFGVKTSKIRVRLYSPVQIEIGREDIESEPDFDFDIGITHTGSTTAFNSLKENLALHLDKLIYIPHHDDFSFEGLVRFIKDYFELITTETKALFSFQGLSEIILVGMFPTDKSPKTFVLTFEYYCQEFLVVMNEILLDNGIEFFGSGKKVGKQIVKQFPLKPIPYIIEYIVKNEIDKTVGGGAQYGYISGENGPASFNIRGLAQEGMFLNGIDLIDDIEEDKCFISKMSYTMIYEPYTD